MTQPVVPIPPTPSPSPEENTDSFIMPFDEDEIMQAMEDLRTQAGLPPTPTSAELNNNGTELPGEGTPVTPPAASDNGVAGDSTDDDTDDTDDTTTAEDNWTWDDGMTITREEARRLAEFDSFLADNPALRSTLSLAAQREAGTVADQPLPIPAQVQQTVQQNVAPTPPEWTQDDPTLLQVWQQQQAEATQRESELAALRTRLDEHENVLRTQADNTTQSFISRARESFRKQHSLDQATMNQIHEVASKVINLEGFLDTIDPYDDRPQAPNPLTAMERAYTMVYESMPATRDKARNELITTAAADIKRKKKASALSSGGASAPRTTAAPTDPADRHAAMVKDIQEQFFPS